MKKGLILIICLHFSYSFVVYLKSQSPQCFYSYVETSEQLLVEIETPIISIYHKILMTVRVGDGVLFSKDIVNIAKMAVPKASTVFAGQPNELISEHEICFSIEFQDNSPSDVEEDDGQQQITPIPKGYILSIKLMTDFTHKLQENIQKIKASNINYPQMEKLSERLTQINTQQVNLHQINEVKQKLTQNFLQKLKEKVIVYSLLQIGMIILFTLLQIRMLRGYLNDLSII